jgi:threonine synthase
LPVQFVVPTGNFGDILAGYYARRMGLPMSERLGVATNSNDILVRFWSTGKYEKLGKVHETMSPAMDIQVSSNFERLLWYLVYENTSGSGGEQDRAKACEILSGWMNQVKSGGYVEVPTTILASARRDFCAERVDDAEV